MGLAEWFRDNIDGPLFGARWVTLSSGALVRLDAEGRVTQGGPPEWQGVHVRDIPHLSRRLRELESIDCSGECTSCPLTFPSKAVAVTALFEANPALFDFVQAEGNSTAEGQYAAWIRGGRRGKKPALGDGDGRFDALNEAWELRGARRVSTWLEAVYVTVPASRRWDDFAERLPVLEEAAGLRLNLPGPAEKKRLAALGADECEARRDRLVAELLASAKESRLDPAAQPAEVPF